MAELQEIIGGKLPIQSLGAGTEKLLFGHIFGLLTLCAIYWLFDVASFLVYELTVKVFW
jgi:hypothetical protein